MLFLFDVTTSNRNNITTQVMYEANLLPWNVSVVDTREVPTQPAQDIPSVVLLITTATLAVVAAIFAGLYLCLWKTHTRMLGQGALYQQLP